MVGNLIKTEKKMELSSETSEKSHINVIPPRGSLRDEERSDEESRFLTQIEEQDSSLRSE
jgi:hypothetical protein